MSERLFGALVSTPEMAALVSDEAWVRAMLDAEAALARASASVGLLPAPLADQVESACRSTDVDPEALRAGIRLAATPVLALVEAIRASLPDAAARAVHRGATTQDIVDTALVLVLRNALRLIASELESVCSAAADLAEHHRGTVMAGRTLLQQASPTTFGAKAAGWLFALLDADEQLARVRRDRLCAQLGGAVGTLAAFGTDGPAVASAFARELGLIEPPAPWHTARGAVLDVAAALGAVARSCETVAVDIVLLAQTEVGEVREVHVDGGRSSALPQKQNPVGAIAVRAASRYGLGRVADLFTLPAHEHERSAGAWQLEAELFTDLLPAVHAATLRASTLLQELAVDRDRMAANLDAAGGAVMAEAVAVALAPNLGWPRAQEIAGQAARSAATTGGTLRAALLGCPEVASALGERGVDEALDPARFLGAADALVERAIAAHGRRTRP
jgi:3-carboxy-cis,cis-muconate cycloisomerase